MSYLKLRPIILLLAFVCLLAAPPARAQDPDMGFFIKDAPVEITADNIRFDKSTNTYYATGNVIIVQDSTTLRSEEVLLNREAGVATAKGTVRVSDDEGNTLTGENLQMNLKEKTAVITNARIFYKEDNLHITAGLINKTGPNTFHIKGAEYTTCDCEPEEDPAWSFRVTSANVTVGQFLRGWNARFYIKGLPMFYFPYVTIPVKRERQSGFLQPRVSYSSLRGFAMDNSLYWAISKSEDATLYLDVETNRGVGEGAEYRYYRTRNSHGEIYAYHFKEKDMERVRTFRQDVDNLARPLDASGTRWQFKMNHAETLDNGISIRADLNLLSDDEYLLDFSRSGEDRTLESIENNVSVSKNWSGYSLVAQFRYFNNLLDAGDKTTLHKLPEITLTSSDRRIMKTPFYISSESSFINFSRKEGASGQRLDITPRIAMPMRPGGYFELTPSIAPRGTFYLIDGSTRDGYMDRYLYEINVDTTTTFVRVFHPGAIGLEAVRHTIRPKLTYTYIPQADQTDVPQFDAVDTVAQRNTVEYSIVSVFTGKTVDEGLAAYRDYAYLDVRQSYNINEATRKLSSDTDERRPFSNVRAELLLKPAWWINLTALGEYDVYDNWFDSYSTSLSTRDRRGDTVNLNYRFVRAEATRYLEASARIRVTRPVDVTYLKRFSFDEDRSLETSYGIEYRHQCWSSVLTYTERLEEKIVYLTFNLMGLGRVADFESKLEPL